MRGRGIRARQRGSRRESGRGGSRREGGNGGCSGGSAAGSLKVNAAGLVR